MYGQLSTISVITEVAQWELLVAVDHNHNQLHTMASETVDPIDWLHPPPSWAVPPERLVHSNNDLVTVIIHSNNALVSLHWCAARPVRGMPRVCSECASVGP